jgi:hypothetical protein
MRAECGSVLPSVWSRAKRFLATSFMLNFSPTDRHNFWPVAVVDRQVSFLEMWPKAAKYI